MTPSEGVKSGEYTANFSRREFLPLDRGAAARRPFRVASGADPIRLRVQLTPLSKVSGRVLDADEHPVPGAELLLDGSHMGLTRTSDPKGNFSFEIAPGSYILSARPPRALKPPSAEDGERLAWAHTYYPGVLDPRAAVKIVVRAGSEEWGQDIRLRAAPVRRMRGVVLDPRGDPAPHVPVQVARIGELVPEDIQTVSAEDGAFEFPALPDGEWRVFAQSEKGGAKVRAFAVAQVAGRDLDGVDLRLTAPFSLHGSVTLGGPVGSKPGAKVGLFLRPFVVGSEGLAQGLTDQDGAFKIDNVYPGLYKIMATSPGPPHFLASVKVGEREALGQYVELGSGALPIKVTFESQGGGIRGTVEDCGSAIVVLTPWDKDLQDPQFVRTAQCREGGRYEISDIRPGDYYAFAFDKWEGPMELISSLDQSLTNQAVAVRVSRGEVATVDLKVTVRNP